MLPVLEEVSDGWRAWRLITLADEPSGYEPPLPGRTGSYNARQNQFADRSAGEWEFAVLSVVPDDEMEDIKAAQPGATDNPDDAQ